METRHLFVYNMCTWNSILRVIETTIGSCLLSNVQHWTVECVGNPCFAKFGAHDAFSMGVWSKKKAHIKLTSNGSDLAPQLWQQNTVDLHLTYRKFRTTVNETMWTSSENVDLNHGIDFCPNYSNTSWCWGPKIPSFHHGIPWHPIKKNTPNEPKHRARRNFRKDKETQWNEYNNEMKHSTK